MNHARALPILSQPLARLSVFVGESIERTASTFIVELFETMFHMHRVEWHVTLAQHRLFEFEQSS